MVSETIFAADIFTKGILPFLLVFTLIFAILDKSKILGDGKRQINAIISLVVALLLVAFAYPTAIITKITVYAAVAAVVIFVFLLLYGFVASDNKEGLKLHSGVKIAGGIIVLIGVVIAVAWATGALNYLSGVFSGSNSTTIWANVLLIAVIIGMVALVLSTKGKGE